MRNSSQIKIRVSKRNSVKKHIGNAQRYVRYDDCNSYISRLRNKGKEE